MAACAAACACFLLLSSPACGIDSVAFEIGRGDDETNLLRIAAQARWDSTLWQGEEWRIGGYWDLAVGVWDNSDESTADIGVTPVFRLEGERLYVEAAIGAHLVQRRISQHRIFSTAFQFGDHLGIGMRARNYDLGIALQHLSNASIRHPNPGINFLLVRLQYRLP
jgi:hypothetical protein